MKAIGYSVRVSVDSSGHETSEIRYFILSRYLSGKRFSEVDEAHLWHFDDRGRVARFRHCADTLQQHRAMK